MKFTYIRKPHSSAEYLEGFKRLLSIVPDSIEFRFYKLDRKTITWLFAVEIEDGERLPPNSIELTNDDELIRYKALKAFW